MELLGYNVSIQECIHQDTFDISGSSYILCCPAYLSQSLVYEIGSTLI